MTDKMPLEKTAEEKLGEYIKRARLAAGIELAELAREIRITPDMLDHLENGRYEKLPVQAYVRGYLNTICTRLELNRAKVLDWYAGEVGRDYAAVIATDQLVSSTVTRPGSSPEKGGGKLVAIVVAVVLVIFVIIMNVRNKDDESSVQAARLADSLDSVAKADSLAGADTIGTADTAGLSADSLTDTTKVDSAASPSADTTTVSSTPETTLKFECIKDSTWVRVKKVGGLSWARLVHKDDKPRFVSHTDTLKVSVGSPEKTKMYINDEKVKIPDNYFKVFNGKIVE